MTIRISPVLPLLALVAAAPAGAAVSDFRLPSSSPTPTSRAQGPVDPENPITRPAPTASPTPAPAAAPTVSAMPSPRLTLPPVTPTPRATVTRRAAAPSSAPGAPAQSTPAPVRDAAPSDAPVALPTNLPAAAPSPPAIAAPVAPPVSVDDNGGLPWGWILLGIVTLAAAGGAWTMRRNLFRRRGSVLIVPDIEKPSVPAPPAPAPVEPELPPEPAVSEEPTHPLLIAITPVKLTQTFMNEALSYRLSLTNVGKVPLGEIAVAADLVSAHASLTREQQLAGPETVLPQHKTIAGIAPGETIEATGEIRTPLAELSVIQQGSAALLVPLARFRISAEGMETRHFTLAVGQQVPGAATLAPIRLDLGPRTTDGLAGRAF